MHGPRICIFGESQAPATYQLNFDIVGCLLDKERACARCGRRLSL